MKGNSVETRTLAICFGQFGPYHHARVAALQRAARAMADGEARMAEGGGLGQSGSPDHCKLITDDCTHPLRVLPVQIAAATTTYAWNMERGTEIGDDISAIRHPPSAIAEGLQTLCEGTDEAASPLGVFLAARRLFKAEGVQVVFVPSYWPARFLAIFIAAKFAGARTVMMNESHAGTERATGWKRWIKRQIVRQFDAALVGGTPQKRHFAALGIPEDKIFTGYDAVDNAYFARCAEDIRAAQKRRQEPVDSGQPERSMGHGAGSAGREGDEGRQDQETRGLQETAVEGEKSEGGKVTSEESCSANLSTLNFASAPSPAIRPTVQHSTAQSTREAYGLPKRYFLSLGRMVEKKNLSTLVAAYGRFARASVEKLGAWSEEHGADVAENCKLNAEHCVPALVFVGSGELEKALESQARALGLEVVDRRGMSWQSPVGSLQTDAPVEAANCELKTEHSVEKPGGAVFFYGFRQLEENPVFYALAEAFILPSLYEEWGLVVNEAMACSLPVIVSRTAGCAEDLLPASGQVTKGRDERPRSSVPETPDDPADRPYLEARSNGFVFDPTSVEALAEALKRLAASEDERKAMGQASREIVGRWGCDNFARQALCAAKAAMS